MLFSGREAVQAYVGSLPPFLAADASSLLVASRAGWMSAQQMGMELLSKARDAGAATLIPSSLQGVRTASDGKVEAALLSVPGESEPLEVRTGAVVNAAGPYAGVVDALLRGGGGEGGGGRELPLQNEVHAKAVLRDDLSAVPGDAPMVVWTDPVTLPWSEEEAEALLEIGGFEASLAGSLPGGFHLRPYPGKPHSLLMLWEAIHADVAVPREPPEEAELRGSLFAELTLRALSRAVPALGGYLGEDGSMTANVSVDGGYYSKAPDNLPLIGPAAGGPRGAYVCAGLSGYGIMAANAAGELLAKHVTGAPLPEAYAAGFLPERWESEEYRRGVESGAVGKGFQI